MTRRIIALIITAALLFSLPGCSNAKKGSFDAVQFYYIRSDYEYHSEENVIVAEQRELSGSKDDLSYLLTLYMLGPIKENLVSPFPSRVRVIDIKEDVGSISITLSGMDALLSDSKFSLAAGCLAMTVFGIRDCQLVCIYSGDRSVSLTKDSFILDDCIAQDSEIPEETQ